MVEWYWILITAILAIIAGLVIGFFLARHFMTKQIKKNPPINPAMIRAMYSRMGRKPSESQIMAVINQMKKFQK